jgi:uncharacterized protein YndB with AHSA1/START domain
VLKKILVVLLVVAAGLAVVIAMQPATFLVTRTTSIAAPPETVFALVNDFHRWDAWSPWAKLDPAMRTTFSGPVAGAGAVYSWIGNSDVGEGRMTVLESRPAELVRINLEFLKPFASTSITEFTFTGTGTSTGVTWTMKGDNNFLSKAMSLFMGGMDKMIGPDFDKGLAQLKAAAEGQVAK